MKSLGSITMAIVALIMKHLELLPWKLYRCNINDIFIYSLNCGNNEAFRSIAIKSIQVCSVGRTKMPTSNKVLYSEPEVTGSTKKFTFLSPEDQCLFRALTECVLVFPGVWPAEEVLLFYCLQNKDHFRCAI